MYDNTVAKALCKNLRSTVWTFEFLYARRIFILTLVKYSTHWDCMQTLCFIHANSRSQLKVNNLNFWFHVCIMFLLNLLPWNGFFSEKMYRTHVSVIRAQGQCPYFMPTAQGQCSNFMLSLEGYSLNSGYILTLVKENAQNTCPWPFMVPVMGLMTFALSNQRHAWLPCHFMSFKTVF